LRSAISPASKPDRASKPQVKSGPDVFADALVPRAAPMAPGAPIFPGIQTPVLPIPGLRPAEAFLRARAAARPSRTFDRHHALSLSRGYDACDGAARCVPPRENAMPGVALMVIVPQNGRVNRIPQTDANPCKTSVPLISPPPSPGSRLYPVHRDH
jgi:hypothetical protein